MNSVHGYDKYVAENEFMIYYTTRGPLFIILFLLIEHMSCIKILKLNFMHVCEKYFADKAF